MIDAGRSSDAFNISPLLQDCDAIVGGLTINGGGGNNTMNVNDQRSSTAAQTYSVNATVLYVRPLSLGIAYTGIKTLVLNGGQGGNTFNINSTGAGTSYTINGGTGGATFDVGGLDRLDGIQGAVTVVGQGGTSTLNVDDQASTAAHNYTLTSTTLARSEASTITFSGLSSRGVFDGGQLWQRWQHHRGRRNAGGEAYTLINGGPGDNLVNVLGSNAAGYLLIDAGGGTSLVRLGSTSQGLGDTGPHGGTLANIKGVVYPFSTTGLATMVIDDGSDPLAHNNVAIYSTQINGLSGTTPSGVIHWQPGQIVSVILYGGHGASVYNVNEWVIGYPLTLYTGTGPDTVNLNNLNDFYAQNLTIHGQGSAADATELQRPAAHRRRQLFPLTAASVARTAPPGGPVVTVTYDGITSLAINGRQRRQHAEAIRASAAP